MLFFICSPALRFNLLFFLGRRRLCRRPKKNKRIYAAIGAKIRLRSSFPQIIQAETKQDLKSCIFILMKIILLYFILFSAFVNSQGNLRLVYEYTYSPDSLNHEYIRTEVYHLDIGDRKSLFYNKNRVSTDTLSQQNFLFSDFNYMLEKDNIAGSVVQYNQLSNFSYQIPDKPEYDWEVINERSKWMNYSVQRAECNFRGRKWNAWFSSDLPFPSGPYKFHGLPGLIVKMSDESNSHSFVLIEVQNQPDPVKIKPSQPLSLSRQSFNKIVKAYRNNYQKELQNIEVLHTEDGLSGADFKKRMQEYHRRKMKQENNFIELE